MREEKIASVRFELFVARHFNFMRRVRFVNANEALCVGDAFIDIVEHQNNLKIAKFLSSRSSTIKFASSSSKTDRNKATKAEQKKTYEHFMTRKLASILYADEYFVLERKLVCISNDKMKSVDKLKEQTRIEKIKTKNCLMCRLLRF